MDGRPGTANYWIDKYIRLRHLEKMDRANGKFKLSGKSKSILRGKSKTVFGFGRDKKGDRLP